MPVTTHVLKVDRDDPDPAVLEQAARVLRAGGLVAFATETVYGLGADATNPEAVARIFAAKGRPPSNPLIVHADGLEMARSCVSTWPDEAQTLGQRFWPGPLTLVLARSSRIPDIVTAGLGSVGVRLPLPRVARGLIARLGAPISAPSANRSSGLSPTRASHVLKDLDGKIELILDSGPVELGLESTVLDLTVSPPRILRPGLITAEQLNGVLGTTTPVGTRPAESPTGRSPGELPQHYQPRTPTVRVAAEQLPSMDWGGRDGLLVLGHPQLSALPGPVLRLDLPQVVEAAAKLYAALHDWDEQGLDRIVIVPPPDSPEWVALRDRIWRATRPHRPA